MGEAMVIRDTEAWAMVEWAAAACMDVHHTPPTYPTEIATRSITRHQHLRLRQRSTNTTRTPTKDPEAELLHLILCKLQPKPRRTLTFACWRAGIGELAFAEMPNMALDFLINNNVSGNSTSDKAK
jgi:hypothetical protein